jgi:signal peptide peptidase SppA
MISSLPLLAIAPGYAKSEAAAWNVFAPRREPPAEQRIGLVQLRGELDKPYLVEARNRVNQLAADNSVGEILIFVDSPGGTVAGTHDLYLAIARAAERKRVTAVCEDLVASAAYYAIAGATEICLNPGGVCGSIGVYMVVLDASKLFERMGVDVIVIRSGPHKGARIEGAKITGEQLEMWQGFVDAQHRLFVAAVAKGRRMKVDRVNDVADGRVLVGEQAVAAGLVDRIATFDDVLAAAQLRTLHLVRGRDAVAAFDQLVAAECKTRGYVSPTWTRVVEERYPELAADANKHRR